MSEDDTIYDGSEDSPNTTIDWSEEAENLSEKGDGGDYPNSWYVRLPEGRTTLRFLSEGNVAEMDDGTEKVFFDVEVANGAVEAFDSEEEETHEATPETEHPLTYSMTRGSTKASQFGQLVQVAAARGGLEGEEVEIMRRGTAKDTQYIILEDELD